MGVPPWGAVALVSYIPDPLRSFLTEMRELIPETNIPEPHITILPPRPLKQPVETASNAIKATLASFTAFTVELSKVRHFPETNFLYLDVAEGNSSIHDLHRALNIGKLAHAERFEFRPHLTLGGPINNGQIHHAERRAEAAWRSNRSSPHVSIEELVCLWLPPHSRCWSDWRRMWSFRLLSDATEPNNGREAEITTQTY
ncbi:MAG: 2'-5' RNA ligase family protein [Acidobacteriaceae bacterium]|nr:2'-5' RNA ligase family protein [Acidobacteriaceae bacterium]